MNHVAVHDILESDLDAPLTDEALEELGFVKGLAGRRKWMNGIAIRVSDDNTVYLKNSNSVWKTVGSVKLLIEALKGDE